MNMMDEVRGWAAKVLCVGLLGGPLVSCNSTGQAADDGDGTPDGGAVEDATPGDTAGDDTAPGDATDASPPDADGSSGTDAEPPPIRCADLSCADEGRACVESEGSADAECGDCLDTFIEEGEDCIAPLCTAPSDCVPELQATEWSVCGGYADVCATEGTQTRTVYTGDCVGGRCVVTEAEETQACPELRVTDGEACEVDTAAGVCLSGACLLPPVAVEGVAASDATSADVVQVTWSALEGATGYRVYRDGVLLTETPITELSYQDATAAAGGVPEPVTGVSAVGEPTQISVSWDAASSQGPGGASAIYTVSAVNPAGDGPASAGDVGSRAGQPLQGYEVRIDGSDAWVSVAVPNYADSDAPAGTMTVTDVSASDGTSTEHVTLSATVSTTPGASRSYEVRAVNAAGAGVPSDEVTGERTAGEPALQWERSSGSEPSGFTAIGSATVSPFDDTDAPADGTERQYRLVVTAPGATTVTSAPDAGFRSVPLGGECVRSAVCPEGSSCSTVEGFERCSPRLFAAEAHQMDFVYVPAGTFQQGTPENTGDESPFLATLTRSYFVSRTEVTLGQWQAVYGEFPADVSSECGPTCPVHRVNWYEALALANRLSETNSLTSCYTLSGCTGRVGGGTGSVGGGGGGTTTFVCSSVTYDTSCTGYRLLTESEWERAARAGTTSTFYWGEATDPTTVSQYGWFSTLTSPLFPQPVGLKIMNPYGLYDMSGNVWEWVWDWYDPSYPTGSATDYTGPASGSERMIRSGSIFLDELFLRSAERQSSAPTSRDIQFGFRLARTVP